MQLQGGGDDDRTVVSAQPWWHQQILSAWGTLGQATIVSFVDPSNLCQTLPTSHVRWEEVTQASLAHLANVGVDFDESTLSISAFPAFLLSGTPMLAW